MRPGLAALIGLLFFAGWLSAAWCVPLLLALMLIRTGNGRHRRPGSSQTSTASQSQSPETAPIVQRVGTYTAWKPDGPKFTVEAFPATHHALSKRIGPGFSTSGRSVPTVGDGVLGSMTAVTLLPDCGHRDKWTLGTATRAWEYGYLSSQDLGAVKRSLGDCGCGDAA